MDFSVTTTGPPHSGAGPVLGHYGLVILFTAAHLLGLAPAVEGQSQSVRVQVIDRGQADGILIRTPNEQWIVIDAGTNREQADAMATTWGVDRLALVITSHRHDDHYGGMAEILRRFPVDRYVGHLGDCPNRTADNTIRDVLTERGIPAQSLGAATITVDGVSFTILPPDPVGES